MSDAAPKQNTTVGWIAAAVALYLAVQTGTLDLTRFPTIPLVPTPAPVIDNRFPEPPPALKTVWAPLTARFANDPAGAGKAAGLYAGVAELVETRPDLATSNASVRTIVLEADAWWKRGPVGPPGTGEWIRDTLKAQVGEDPTPLDDAKRRAFVEQLRAIAWALKEAA